MVFISTILNKIMSRLSKFKKDRLKEEILRVFYENYPNFIYTYQIAENLIRDDEFILNLLKELKHTNFIVCLEETSGNNIKRKWGMKKEVYETYKNLSV